MTANEKNALGLVGFPTPDEAVGEDAYLLFLFPDPTWAQWLLGALAILTYEYNWYEAGDLFPDEAADTFRLIIEQAPYNLITTDETVPAPFWDEDSGDDADDEAPVDDQHWYGQWDGETFLETVSYVFLTAFLSTITSPQGAIKFLTIPRTFRMMVRQNPHGAKLLLFLDGGLYGVINGYAPIDQLVETIVVSPGTEMLLVHSGEHDPAATPDDNGDYTIDVVRMRLAADDVLPPTIRYTDTDPPVFQTTSDGGTTWTDAPNADPRTDPALLKPPLTPYTGIECDAAARITAQIKDTLDIFIATGDAAQFATGVMALMIAILGPVGWLLDALIFAGNALVDIGQANIESAFTEAIYDDIQCIISCYVGEDGSISQSALESAFQDIIDAHSGTVAATMQKMLFFYGYVPFSNAVVARDETGDCSGCAACEWFVEYDFATGTHGFNVLVTSSGSRGTYVGDHFEATPAGGVQLFLSKQAAGVQLSGMSAFLEANHGTGIGNARRWFDVTNFSPVTITTKQTFGITNITPAGWQTEFTTDFTSTLGYGFDFSCDSNNTGSIKLYKVRISGTGAAPTDGIRVTSL